MKGFGRLILIFGLVTVASLVYTQAWDTAFGKGPNADTFEDMKNNAAKVRRIVKEAEEDQKNRDKNPKGITKTDAVDIKDPSSNPQHKKEKVINNNGAKEVFPDVLTTSDSDSIVQSSKRKRKREDPFKDVVLQTTSEEIHSSELGSLRKQSEADTFTNKKTRARNNVSFTNELKAPTASISKARNTNHNQEQTSKSIEQIPSEENISVDVNKP